MQRFWLVAGALNMLLALIVAAGTGHQIQGEFVPLIRNTLDTAREMHFVHALALIAVGIISLQPGRTRLVEAAGWAFLTGIVLFCGGIYATRLLDLAGLAPAIPVGGVALMAGWILLATGGWFLKR